MSFKPALAFHHFIKIQNFNRITRCKYQIINSVLEEMFPCTLYIEHFTFFPMHHDCNICCLHKNKHLNTCSPCKLSVILVCYQIQVSPYLSPLRCTETPLLVHSRLLQQSLFLRVDVIPSPSTRGRYSMTC